MQDIKSSVWPVQDAWDGLGGSKGTRAYRLLSREWTMHGQWRKRVKGRALGQGRDCLWVEHPPSLCLCNNDVY